MYSVLPHPVARALYDCIMYLLQLLESGGRYQPMYAFVQRSRLDTKGRALSSPKKVIMCVLYGPWSW